jgi:hypothetical protein
MRKNKTFLKHFFTFFLFILSFYQLLSQNPVETYTKLVQSFKELRQIKNDSLIDVFAPKIDSIYKVLLDYPSFSQLDVSELKNFSSILFSKDKKFIIVTWNVFHSDGQFFYYGYIRLQDKNSNVKLVPLIDKSAKISNPQFADLKPSRWFGCIYYQMVQKKVGRTIYYTLLGWDGNTFLSNKKIIEVVTLKGKRMRFGYDFDINGLRYKRLIFEYNEQAEMVLHWDNNAKMIVWDHLAPSKPKFKGMYQFYGPDFSYDGLVWKHKHWQFVQDIDVKNPEPKIKK